MAENPRTMVPVILSGGAGTRLWPVSREEHPKPFIQLADGESLLQKTLSRINDLQNIREILTITNRDYLFKTKNEYEKVLGSKHPHTFLLEPCGRNTAPAILIAAFAILEQHGPDTIMLVMPADHLIENSSTFLHTVEQACLLAEASKLVTFGIIPTSPETGFGYIEYGKPTPVSGSFDVTRFVEKPSYDTACEYIASGNYLWNAGIFCFKVETILNEFKLHTPDLYQKALLCWKTTQNKISYSSVIDIDTLTFSDLPDISIDYAIMEKSQQIAVVSSHFTWNDIGSWDRMIPLFQTDSSGNIANNNNAVFIESHNTFIYGYNRLVATVGADNLVIIDTPDALLVAHRDNTQAVKTVVQQLKNKSHPSCKTHCTTIRPWGSYTIIDKGENFKIKRIVVNPGASLSLQMHHHRSEHWVVIEGIAKVTNGSQELILHANESTFIPQNNQHRLENLSDCLLVLIEVQTGTYLEEDDIIRFDDQYGRHHSRQPA